MGKASCHLKSNSPSPKIYKLAFLSKQSLQKEWAVSFSLLFQLTQVTLPRREKSNRKIVIKWDNITGYLYSTAWGTKMFNYQNFNKKCFWTLLSIPLSPGYPSFPGCPGMPFSPLSPLLPGGPGGPGGPGSPGFNLSSQTGTGFLECSWMNESNFNTWAERGRQKMNVSLAGKFRKETNQRMLSKKIPKTMS